MKKRTTKNSKNHFTSTHTHTQKKGFHNGGGVNQKREVIKRERFLFVLKFSSIWDMKQRKLRNIHYRFTKIKGEILTQIWLSLNTKFLHSVLDDYIRNKNNNCYEMKLCQKKTKVRDFPGGPVVKSLPANAGVIGSIPGQGRYHMPQSNEACAPQLLSPSSRAHKP